MVPVILRGLGPAVFGAWIVLNTLMITMQLFNLNIGLTTIRQIALLAGRGNHRAVNLALSAIIRITILLGVGAFGIGILISMVLPHWNFLGIDEAVAGNVTACIMLSTVIVGAKYLDQVSQSVLKAYERYKPAAILNLCNRTGLLFVNVVLALMHAAIIDLLVANLVFTTLYLLICMFVIRRSVPTLRLYLFRANPMTLGILSFSVWPWMQSIIAVLVFQTDRFWVSSTAGLEAVSSYGLVATMFNHIHMIFAAMAGWILPRISGMVAQGNDPARLYNQVRGILFGIIVSSLIVFYFASPYLFPVWVGQDTYQSMAPYIRAFTCFELVCAHTIMPFFYLNAAGREKEGTMLTLFYGAGCYILMVMGLQLTGSPEYLVHGMTLSLCLTMPVVNYIVKKRLYGRATVKEIIGEMVPIYLAIASIVLPQWWMSALLIPVILILLYQFYVSPFFERKLWRLPVNR